MRRDTRGWGALAAAAILLGSPGCRMSTRSDGLPEHIRTVEVHVFKNNTMYKGLEGKLTRGVIDAVNADPVVRAASRNGDAILTGEITRVSRRTLRETTSDERATVQIVIDAVYSFYDERSGVYLADEAPISSADLGLGAGIFETSLSEPPAAAEARLLNDLGAEIVRRTVGMW